MKQTIILLLLCTTFLYGKAQDSTQVRIVGNVSDTLIIEDSLTHSPVKATFMSLALPGLGQAYNKKYWKIPLVYAIIGTPLYFALQQKSQYNDFKSAYIKRLDDDATTIDTKYADVYTDDNLKSLIDYHRGNRDLLFVLTGVAYALNVLDAAVDAHLYYFEVSDDLTGVFRPNVKYYDYNNTFVPSLTLTLKIGKNNQQQFY
jgi:hypothetical protein